MTESVKKQLGKLNSIYKKLSRRLNGDVIDYANLLAKLELIPTLIRFMSTPRENYFETPCFTNLNSLFTLVWNTSDQSKDICTDVVEKKLHKVIITDFQKPVLKVGNLKSPDGAQQMNPIRVVKAFFAILYNTLRNLPTCKQSLREAGLIDITLTYLDTTILSIKAKALLTLTFAADLEVSHEMIQATGSNIDFIVRKLFETAINSPRHRSPKYGYTVEELMEGFCLLSKNANNAVQLVNLGILNHCEKLLEKEFSEIEIKWTLDFIWSLTFVDKLREKITERDRIMNQFDRFKGNQNREIADAVNGILWQLRESDATGTEVAQLTENALSRHIMISYNWTQQTLALKIFEKLKNAGKEVWMDVEKMHGDSIEKMADAVENSSHIVCCFSEEYSNSQACRSEVTYAYKKKKEIVFAKMEPSFEPNGWLGFILGANIYYLMFDEHQIEREFSKLLAYIDRTHSRSFENELGKSTSVAVTNAAPKKLSKLPENSTQLVKVSKWTSEEVKKWFASIGCSQSTEVLSYFDEIDGKLLSELRIWQSESPEYFFNFADQKLGLGTSVNLLKFSYALRNLDKS